MPQQAHTRVAEPPGIPRGCHQCQPDTTQRRYTHPRRNISDRHPLCPGSSHSKGKGQQHGSARAQRECNTHMPLRHPPRQTAAGTRSWRTGHRRAPRCQAGRPRRPQPPWSLRPSSKEGKGQHDSRPSDSTAKSHARTEFDKMHQKRPDLYGPHGNSWLFPHCQSLGQPPLPDHWTRPSNKAHPTHLSVILAEQG
jgi:hypothetical protein